MVWWARARRQPQANQALLSRYNGHRHGSATGAAAPARRLFAKDSYLAVELRENRNVKEDLTVTISPELEAQILRYHHVEKWRIGTIARQLQLHYDTVSRVLAQAGVPIVGQLARRSQLDPYLPFVREILEKYPSLTASRLYVMVRERGYSGGPDHFRHLVAHYRPRPKAEAYLRLRTLAGEQAQIDWGHFGSLEIGRARRPLLAFVMVLSYSRRIFLRFFLNARIENFLRGHVAAFTAWHGVPRILLYDNLKSVVLERDGGTIRFHPTLWEFSGHYRYEPRPVAVARGNEKGRVERAIRYVRGNFFAARDFVDLEDLNQQAEAWCNGAASDRRCPDQNGLSVREAFAEEAPRLLNLPDTDFPLLERKEVSVGKTPYVRFDLNDYSIPHTHVRRSLTVLADLHEVRIIDGPQVLARHPRSYDRGAEIEEPAHIADLVKHKQTARRHRATNQLALAAPASQILIQRAAELGHNLGSITATLMQLLARYGAAELQAAITDALDRGVPHPNAVLLALERRREQRNQPPPIAVNLPKHVQERDAPVKPHNLDIYDQLRDPTDDQ
jgi:transposase